VRGFLNPNEAAPLQPCGKGKTVRPPFFENSSHARVNLCAGATPAVGLYRSIIYKVSQPEPARLEGVSPLLPLTAPCACVTSPLVSSTFAAFLCSLHLSLKLQTLECFETDALGPLNFEKGAASPIFFYVFMPSLIRFPVRLPLMFTFFGRGCTFYSLTFCD